MSVLTQNIVKAARATILVAREKDVDKIADERIVMSLSI